MGKIDNAGFNAILRSASLGDVPIVIEYDKTDAASRRKICRFLRSSGRITSNDLDLVASWAGAHGDHPGFWRKKLACGLIVEMYHSASETISDIILKLADDDDWGVREDVTWTIKELFDIDFDRTMEQAPRWCCERSDRIARAIGVGLARHGRSRHPAEVARILDVMTILARRRDVYVRKNLGPFCIGSYLLSYFPQETLTMIKERWMCSDVEQVRWNAAMSFSASAGSMMLADANAVLDGLAGDESPFVVGAASAAAARIFRNTGGGNQSMIAGWRDSPQRRRAYDLTHQKIGDMWKSALPERRNE